MRKDKNLINRCYGHAQHSTSDSVYIVSYSVDCLVCFSHGWSLVKRMNESTALPITANFTFCIPFNSYVILMYTII